MQTMGLSREIDALVGALRDEAGLAHGVPATIVERACSATARKFEGGHTVSAGRVRAYFWGVVRRTALGSREDAGGLRTRYLAAALVDDLLRAGHPSECVRDAVARRFGTTLPQDALDRIGYSSRAPLTART
jgi:hypothetical protein